MLAEESCLGRLGWVDDMTVAVVWQGVWKEGRRERERGGGGDGKEGKGREEEKRTHVKKRKLEQWRRKQREREREKNRERGREALITGMEKPVNLQPFIVNKAISNETIDNSVSL